LEFKNKHRQKTKLTLVVVAILASASILATNYSNFLFKADVALQSHDFYISPTGSDSNPGTIGAPFSTIGKAQQSIQDIKSAGNFGGATVYLRSGTYSLDSTINFTDDDSGTANYPITYKNYQNEKPVITGSKAITGWTLKSGSNTIYQTDLAAQNLSDKKISNVFFNGSKQILARTPNYVAPDFSNLNVDPYNTGTDNWFLASSANYTSPGDPESNSSLKYNSVDLGGNQTVPDELNADAASTNKPQIETYVQAGWWGELHDMTTVDSANNQINFSLEQANGETEKTIHKNDRYLIQNYLSALDASKEWYQDLTNNILYYMPSSSIDSGTITASTFADDAFNFTNASNINFQGLDFEQFGGKIFDMVDSHDISINHNVFANNNDTAINIATQTLGHESNPQNLVPVNITLDHNNFHDIGWAGVNIELDHGYAKNLINSNIVISNNTIHDVGQKSDAYYETNNIYPLFGAGINFDQNNDATGVIVKNNEIYNMPRDAIDGSGNNNIIEYNKIYNTMLTTEDGGAIDFNTSSWMIRGNIIDSNYISDTHGYGRYPWASTDPDPQKPPSKMVFNIMANSIYLDNFTSGTTVTNNVLVNSSNSHIQNNSGRDNVFENNIFVQKSGFYGDAIAFSVPPYDELATDDPTTTFCGLWSRLDYVLHQVSGYDAVKYRAEYNKNDELTNIPSQATVDSAKESNLIMTNNTVKNNIFDYSANAVCPNIYPTRTNSCDSRLDSGNDGPEDLPYRIQDLSNDQTFNNNLFWGGSKTFGVDNLADPGYPNQPIVLNTWQARGFDKNSIFVDPLFKDYANDDFSLAANSPAINMGFQPIDMSQIGPLAEDDLIQLGSVRPITFKSVYHLSGTKTADVAHVFINGVEATSYTTTGWTGDVTLSNITNTTLNNPGDNAVAITATDGSGKATNQINRYLYCRKLGDATGDSKVDYLDLSKLATSWNKDTSTGAGTNYLADFNENNIVDVYDFSILATSWKK
jgi:hypothetical protein